MFYNTKNDLLCRIHDLQEELKVVRAEKSEIQDKLFTVLRLNKTQTVITQAPPISIHGIVSPSKQRHSLEVESRQKYWKQKMEQEQQSQPETISKTVGE